MYLGIEIGGTKLQLGAGNASGPTLTELVRLDVDRSQGAAGILSQIRTAGQELVGRLQPKCLGIGFGGPVDSEGGHVITSHQVAGWEGIPLVQWCAENLALPAVLGNDCDCAALAEARFGAGSGKPCVFYVTVGTGIGGGLVIDGQLHGRGRAAVAEIGHLRPGPAASSPQATVESLASGLGIVAVARELLRESPDRQACDELLSHCDGDPAQLTAQHVGTAAGQQNPLAQQTLHESLTVLGWAMAQVITLVAPDMVVVGGGVTLLGERLFFDPLRAAIARFVFPPLREACAIVPAALGEEVVVHGALALAAGHEL